MTETNKTWVINCINSCNNLDQLKACEILISLFKFRLAKDKMKESDIYKFESDLLEAYIEKESTLMTNDIYEINFNNEK